MSDHPLAEGYTPGQLPNIDPRASVSPAPELDPWPFGPLLTLFAGDLWASSFHSTQRSLP
jgi:hypothetical protein